MEINENEILSRMVEVELARPDSFLIIKETLTRIGVPSVEAKRLHQSCHIFHKSGKYYISHFKLLFEMDGKPSTIDAVDIARQKTVAHLLETWNLLTIKTPVKKEELISMKMLKIVHANEKDEWELVPKHRIGRNKR